MGTRGWGTDRRTALLALAAIAARPRVAGATGDAGSVEALEGRAFARQSQVRPLLLADPVMVRDRVWTASDSRATLLLEPVTRVHLGPDAALTIDRFLGAVGGELYLHDGGMVFDRPEGEGLEMSVRSSHGLIGVRGTRFFAGPSNGVFGVFVARGLVTVQAAGVRREVPAGSGVDIAGPGAAPTEPRVWGAPRVAAALALVRPPI
jgi:ferric-dicitrate binding protein FerR (iron transport regulator)